MNYEEMLSNLAKQMKAIKIPNLMNVSDTDLRNARIQKDEVIKEIHRIRKLIRNKENEI